MKDDLFVELSSGSPNSSRNLCYIYAASKAGTSSLHVVL